MVTLKAINKNEELMLKRILWAMDDAERMVEMLKSTAPGETLKKQIQRINIIVDMLNRNFYQQDHGNFSLSDFAFQVRSSAQDKIGMYGEKANLLTDRQFMVFAKEFSAAMRFVNK